MGTNRTGVQETGNSKLERAAEFLFLVLGKSLALIFIPNRLDEN